MAKRVLKKGWHPENDKFSDILHRNKGASRNAAALNHSSAPLDTLKDPSAFGPPPKHINYHGAGALPNKTTPDTSGLGKPLSAAQISAYEDEHQDVAKVDAAPPPPSIPYRANTSGLSTSNLPSPPIHRAIAETAQASTKPPAPSLPPRLPPRSTSASNSPTSPTRSFPLPLRTGSNPAVSSQSSTNRLGAAGISVPGFGISRSTTTTPSSHPPPASSSGTTLSQKRAALTTASRLRSDPSTVSLSEARDAAKTANNFRERHGEQVIAGAKKAQEVNRQYGVVDKVEGMGERLQQQGEGAGVGMGAVDEHDQEGIAAAAKTKKKPPPPPPKKKGLGGSQLGEGADGPPVVPLASRPRV